MMCSRCGHCTKCQFPLNNGKLADNEIFGGPNREKKIIDLPLLLGYETSKPVPIVIATLLQRERVLTFHKCRKYREIGFWKPVLVAKFAENDPQMASKACLKDGKWTPQIPCPIGNHFSWGLGYFARQTKLKWTKNFKALFLSLTKYNGTVFWRFATDLY